LNPVGGEIFHTCPDQPWGPPSLLYNGYGVFPGGKECGPGVKLTPHPLLVPYLYSTYGPYGLYRASVPVQGCTLPFLTIKERGTQWHNRLRQCATSQKVVGSIRDDVFGIFH